MTNEEAIKNLAIVKNLEDALGNFDGGVKNSDLSKSLAMAIKALGHQPCDDCISRQQAIEAINHICPVDTEYDCTLLDRVDVRCVLLDLTSAQRWIPVSERLPEEDGCYLVTTTGTNNDIIDIAYYTDGIWHKASRIKAWMPLPKPYKAESEVER